MPNCTVSPAGPAAGLFGPKLVVTGRRQGGVERFGVLPGIVGAAGNRRHRERGRIDEVAAPDLGRVDAELIGGDVEYPLDQLGGFRAPGAPIRADGSRVGHYRGT